MHMCASYFLLDEERPFEGERSRCLGADAAAAGAGAPLAIFFVSRLKSGMVWAILDNRVAIKL